LAHILQPLEIPQQEYRYPQRVIEESQCLCGTTAVDIRYLRSVLPPDVLNTIKQSDPDIFHVFIGRHRFATKLIEAVLERGASEALVTEIREKLVSDLAGRWLEIPERSLHLDNPGTAASSDRDEFRAFAKRLIKAWLFSGPILKPTCIS
jgi:hypothetical protein